MMSLLGAGGAVAIAGCAGGEDPRESDGDIQFLTMGVGDNIAEYFEENNAAFEEEFDAELDFTSVTWDNAQSTLNTRVDGGEAPDVSRLPARWIPEFAGKEALIPLDEMMEGEFGDQFYEGLVESNYYDGHYYGAPWAQSNKCLYYNKDVFEEAGLDPEDPGLDTWDDMLEAAIEIRDNADTSAYGLPANAALETGSQYCHYHWSFGADLIDDDGNPAVNSDEGVEALTFYSDLAQEHEVTQPSPLSSSRQDVRRLFENGDLGMVIAHVYAGLNIEDSDQDFDYGIVQVPEGPAGRYNLSTVDSLVIYTQTENEDLARNLFEFYYDEERRFDYSRKKGFLPVLESVAERDFFTEDENWAPFVEASEHARSRPKIANFNEFNNRVVSAIQEAVGGEQSPQDALDDAQEDLEGLSE